MLYVILFTYGLVVGSFGYAWVFRMRRNQSIAKGRSRCDHCKHELAGKDLIPLFSWLSLKGRCRYCKKPLSNKHPIIEVISAAVFVVAGMTWPYPLEGSEFIIYFVIWLLVLANLTIVSIYDFLYKEIPMILQKVNFILITNLFLMGWYLGNLTSADLLSSLLGAAVLFGSFLAVHHFSEGKWMGGADVYLVAPFGLALGVVKGLLSIMLASYIALAAILIGWVSHHQKGKEIPFGPFLSLGFAIAFIYGQDLIDFIAG